MLGVAIETILDLNLFQSGLNFENYTCQIVEKKPQKGLILQIFITETKSWNSTIKIFLLTDSSLQLSTLSCFLFQEIDRSLKMRTPSFITLLLSDK